MTAWVSSCDCRRVDVVSEQSLLSTIALWL